MTTDKPVDIVRVSYSEIQSWRRCQFQHWLGYRRRFQPTTTRAPLERGSAWDAILNLHYGGILAAQQEGVPYDLRMGHEAYTPARLKIQALLADDSTKPDHEREAIALLAWMFDGYIQHWGADERWEILSVQRKMEQRLSCFDVGDRIIDLRIKGFLDLLVRELPPGSRRKGRRGVVKLIDTKTTSALGRKELEFDDQSGLYLWLLNQEPEFKDNPVLEAEWSYTLTRRNKVKAQPLEERFKRMPVHKSPAELEEVAIDATESAWQAYSHPVEWQPPRSPDPELCRRMCDFTTPCLAHRKGGKLERLLRVESIATPAWFKGDQMPLGLDQFNE